MNEDLRRNTPIIMRDLLDSKMSKFGIDMDDEEEIENYSLASNACNNRTTSHNEPKKKSRYNYKKIISPDSDGLDDHYDDKYIKIYPDSDGLDDYDEEEYKGYEYDDD